MYNTLVWSVSIKYKTYNTEKYTFTTHRARLKSEYYHNATDINPSFTQRYINHGILMAASQYGTSRFRDVSEYAT